MTTTEKLAEREAFEAEYRLIFPLTTELEPDKFRREPDGDYEDPTVQVAWHLWQARAALAATPAASQPAARVPLTDVQRIDWLCEQAEYTCGQWQVVIDCEEESFLDAVDKMAALAHGIAAPGDTR